jgi:hypothetical protein
MTRVTCAECRFWSRINATDKGTCRRHAPQVGVVSGMAQWPGTQATDNCGDAEVEASDEWPLELRGPVCGRRGQP